ncbi:MAG: molybdopterin-binding protein, partial [Hyphomicrobiales bacterium]|nr:molybdopterin-binding protein [Hyphomicrobiales bacterium]
MRFGATPVADALGGIVVHAVRHEGLVLKKGHRVTGQDIEALQNAGIDAIVLARLDDGDVGEDAAAHLLAQAIAGANVRVQKPFTGRSNLFSTRDGVLCIDPHAIDAINDVDSAVTVATLERWRRVVAGEMIGTVKIIPFAVAGAVLDKAAERAGSPPLSVAAFRPQRIGVVSTLLSGLKPATIAKTLRVLNDRIAPAGATVVAETRVPHESEPLARAIADMAPQCDIVIVFGASAITDRRDVIPAALEGAGGVIEHFGMPVDPGNLLLIGELEGKPVVGAPGCARSP